MCYANYCRSPVTEKILINRFSSEFNFSSYGIDPLYKNKMDDRSISFLKSINIYEHEHIPKQINLSALTSADMVFCMDHMVLAVMNQKYKKFSSKFKLINFKNPKIIIEDPYRHNNEDYENNMRKIFTLCNELEATDF